MRTKKRLAIWICFLALLVSCVFSPAAFAQEGEQPSEQPASESAPSQETVETENEEDLTEADPPDDESAADPQESETEETEAEDTASDEADPEEPASEQPQPEDSTDEPNETDDPPLSDGSASDEAQGDEPASDEVSADETPAEGDESTSDETATDETPAEEDEPATDGNSVYTVTLDTQIISVGNDLFYQTVSPALAGNPFAAAYYPGELVVEITGQLVIEEGGSLTIGTMSVESVDEASPVIRGELRQDGLIVVKAGGSLTLTTAVFDLSGEGLLIVQEPGGSVTLTDTSLDDSLIQWATPMVNNTRQPSDLWLEEGTPLTDDLLPEQLKTWLQSRGTEQWVDIPLQWDLTNYNGQASGELLLTGHFLDESGDILTSSRPLELTVHWYRPDQIVVTDAVWMGETAASAKLQVEQLPEMATEVWGEVSTDEGETWTRWEDFHIRENDDEVACVFYLQDDTPRYFRIRASNTRMHLYWSSDSFLLPEEDGDDGGGNRGGSITPTSPAREPEAADPQPTPAPEPEPIIPEPDPTPEPEPETPEPDPAPELSSDLPETPPDEKDAVDETEPSKLPAVTPDQPKQDTSVNTPVPDVQLSPEPSLETGSDTEVTPPPDTSPTSLIPDETSIPLDAAQDQSEKDSGLTPLSQAVLAVTGVGASAAAGIAVTRKGIFRKKKK